MEQGGQTEQVMEEPASPRRLQQVPGEEAAPHCEHHPCSQWCCILFLETVSSDSRRTVRRPAPNLV